MSAATLNRPANVINTRKLPAPKRSRVKHLYWVRNIDYSADTGQPVPTLCGKVWKVHDTPAHKEEYVEIIGGLMPLPKVEDCKLCLRVLEADQRRQWRHREFMRWERSELISEVR